MRRSNSHENRMVPYNYQPCPYPQPQQPYPAYPFPYHQPHHVYGSLPHIYPYPQPHHHPQMHCASYSQNPDPYSMHNSQIPPGQNPTCPPQEFHMGSQQPSNYQISLSQTVINMYQVQNSNQPQAFPYPSPSSCNPSITISSPLQSFPSTSQGSHMNPMPPQSHPCASACHCNPSFPHPSPSSGNPSITTSPPLQSFPSSSQGSHMNPMPPQSHPCASACQSNPSNTISSPLQSFPSSLQGHPMNNRESPETAPTSVHQPSSNAEDGTDQGEDVQPCKEPKGIVKKRKLLQSDAGSSEANTKTKRQPNSKAPASTRAVKPKPNCRKARPLEASSQQRKMKKGAVSQEARLSTVEKLLVPNECDIEDDCPICLQALQSPYKCENCTTLFCLVCFHEWAKNAGKCPICRYDVDLIPVPDDKSST